MNPKRRSPVLGPLVTFALMIGSVAAVGAVAHYVDSHPKAPAQTIAVSAGQSAQASVRQ